MAKTNIKKNAKGYGYTYTDLAEIHNQMEELGLTYYQYIDYNPDAGCDYIMTVINDGEKDRISRGCRIVEAKLSGKENPVQAYGASLTYCRRYSLLLALGWATTDDDAACLTVTKEDKEKMEQEELEHRVSLISEARALTEKLEMNEEDVCDMSKDRKFDSYDDMETRRLENLVRWLKLQDK